MKKFCKDNCSRNIYFCRAFLLSRLSLGLEDSGLILGDECKWDTFASSYKARYKEMIEYSAKPNWGCYGNASHMADLSKLIILDKERHNKEKYTRCVAISLRKDAKRQQARIKQEFETLKKHEKMEKYLGKILALGDFLAYTDYTVQSAERILAFFAQELVNFPQGGFKSIPY